MNKSQIFGGLLFPLYIFLSGCLTFAALNAQDPEPRDMMFLRGAGPFSNSWTVTGNELKNRYSFNRIVNSDFYNPTLGVLDAKDLLLDNITSKDVDDVLCISHDYGGIIGRYTQLETDIISSMVFIGVPHQGSQFIFENLAVPGQNPTDIMLDQALEVVGQNECQFCGVLNQLRAWIEDIQEGSEYLKDIQYRSSIIENLENNPPSVPYINVIGNVEPKTFLSFISLLASRNSLGGAPNYTLINCYVDEKNAALKDLRIAEFVNEANILAGVFQQITRSISGVLEVIGENPDPGEALNAIGGVISSTVQIATEALEKTNELEKEKARILRCDLALQMVAVELNTLLTSNNGGFLTEEVIVSTPEDYYTCYYDCLADHALGEFDAPSSCEDHCSHYDPNENITREVTIFKFLGHDWVYSELEQTLDTDQKVEEIVINADHFQETLKDFIIDPVLNDIFDGAYGAAFEVPKK